jgi:hypothetical protein
VSDDSLFREVDEEIRQEQLKKIWQRYGNIITAVAVGIVLAVAGLKGWQYWQLKQSEAAAATYFSAVKLANDGNAADAEKLFASIGHKGFAQLARLREAASLAAAGKNEEAAKSYDAITADESLDQTIRDLARIRAGYILADTLTPDELLGRLGVFDKDESPWRNPAREIFGLAAWRTGDYAMAQRYMMAIASDPAAPSEMQRRALVMLQLLGPLIQK